MTKIISALEIKESDVIIATDVFLLIKKRVLTRTLSTMTRAEGGHLERT